MTTIDLGALADMATGTARQVVVGDRKIALVRIGSDVYAIGDTCSHADVSLAEGEVIAEDCEIECWKHGSAFSLTTGAPSTLPATQPVPVYAVSVADGRILLVIDGETLGKESA